MSRKKKWPPITAGHRDGAGDYGKCMACGERLDVNGWCPNDCTENLDYYALSGLDDWDEKDESDWFAKA
jgi:hypothetical protein